MSTSSGHVPAASPSGAIALLTAQAEGVVTELRALFGAAVDELRVEGDEPLVLDDPGFVYVTQNPHHQLFCVGHQNGKAHGRREHVAMLEPGQLLMALPPSDAHEEPTVLLLSGAAASHVLRLPTRLLIEKLASSDADRAVVERLFDGWIQLLIAMLPSAPVPTRCEAVGAGLTLGPIGTPLRATAGVVWIALPVTPNRFGGVRVGSHDDVAPRQWPLTETTWVVGGIAAAPFSMRAPSTATPLSVQGEWSAGAKTSTSRELVLRNKSASFAEEFYRFVVAFLARHRVGLERARLEQDGASHVAEREQLGDALRQLALVGRGERLLAAELDGDAYEQAGAHIAKFLDVPDLRAPWPKGRERASLGKVQTALSLITTVRTRRVLLEGKWFTHDSGALLGFRLDDGDEVNDDRLNPVALIPASSGGYLLHDARSPDGAVKVTAEIAERLHPQAYQFYPTLPDRPLRPWDVLRFSARGAVKDVLFVVGVGMALGSLTTLIPILTGQVFDNLIPGAERALLMPVEIVNVAVDSRQLSCMSGLTFSANGRLQLTV